MKKFLLVGLKLLEERILGQRHFYYISTQNPWLFLTALNTFAMVLGAIMYFHTFVYGLYYLISGLLGLIFIMLLWFRDVIREGIFEGMFANILLIIKMFIDFKWTISNKFQSFYENGTVRNDPLLFIILAGTVMGACSALDYYRVRCQRELKKGNIESNVATNILTSDTFGLVIDVSRMGARITFGFLVWSYMTGRIGGSGGGGPVGVSSTSGNSTSGGTIPNVPELVRPAIVDLVKPSVSHIENTSLIQTLSGVVSKGQSILVPQHLIRPVIIGASFELMGSKVSAALKDVSEKDLPNVSKEEDLPNVSKEEDLPNVSKEEDLLNACEEEDLLNACEEEDLLNACEEDLLNASLEKISTVEEENGGDMVSEFVLSTTNLKNKPLVEVEMAYYMPDMWRILKYNNMEFLKILADSNNYQKLKESGLYKDFVLVVGHYINYFNDLNSDDSTATWGGLIKKTQDVDVVISKIKKFFDVEKMD